MTHRKTSGLTLIELMITIAVVGIMGLSIPHLSVLLIKQRLNANQNELRLFINRARLEALTRHQRITLCPLTSANFCQIDWTGELAIFVDGNGNRKLDVGEQLLHKTRLHPMIITRWSGMGRANSLHFSAQGVTFVSNGTFNLCHPDHTETFRLIVNRQGRARSERISQGCQGQPTT